MECQDRRLVHSASSRVDLDLKAQMMEMAREGEYDSDEESLRKVEKRELSVLDIFQKIWITPLCCMASTENHCN